MLIEIDRMMLKTLNSMAAQMIVLERQNFSKSLTKFKFGHIRDPSVDGALDDEKEVS